MVRSAAAGFKLIVKECEERAVDRMSVNRVVEVDVRERSGESGLGWCEQCMAKRRLGGRAGWGWDGCWGVEEFCMEDIG